MKDSFKRVFSFGFEIIQTFVLAAAIFVVIYMLAAQLHQVQGSSMEDNFHNGEYILTEKISFRFRSPERGEVIIFEAPNKDREYIKRVIGLPGETLRIVNNSIYINGRKMSESYISAQTYSGSFIKDGQELTMPNDSFFVMGDNRQHSSDSREFGPILKKSIIGRAVFRFWPLNKFGVLSTPKY